MDSELPILTLNKTIIPNIHEPCVVCDSVKLLNSNFKAYYWATHEGGPIIHKWCAGIKLDDDEKNQFKNYLFSVAKYFDESFKTRFHSQHGDNYSPEQLVDALLDEAIDPL